MTHKTSLPGGMIITGSHSRALNGSPLFAAAIPQKERSQVSKMTIKDTQCEKSDALSPSHSDNTSASPIDLDEIDPPPATNPEYNDPTGDSVIVVNDARVVIREDKKTILLPDFSQKIIEHRHMDDGTVDVFTRHVHNDGTCTYFEQLGVAESELALGPDGPCSSDQYKAGSTYPSRPTKPNGLISGGNHNSGAPHHPNDQHENMKRKRLNKLVIHIIIFVALIVLAALYAEFLFFPAIIVGIVVIANAVQLITGETECCSCCDDCCDGCCDDGCDPPSV